MTLPLATVSEYDKIYALLEIFGTVKEYKNYSRFLVAPLTEAQAAVLSELGYDRLIFLEKIFDLLQASVFHASVLHDKYMTLDNFYLASTKGMTNLTNRVVKIINTPQQPYPHGNNVPATFDMCISKFKFISWFPRGFGYQGVRDSGSVFSQARYDPANL